MTEKYNTIVVGAGQAGLATSYHLKQRGVNLLLLDRGRPGEVWRTQRGFGSDYQFPFSPFMK